jgi:hypothetical protein
MHHTPRIPSILARYTGASNNDIMVYHGMSRETMQELYDRSQDDVRGSFADSHPL